MRIYLTEPREILEAVGDGTDRKILFPKAGFYNAPDDYAEIWIDEGLAFEATENNKIHAWIPGSDESVIVDLDAGQTIDGYTTKFVPPLEEDEDPDELEDTLPNVSLEALEDQGDEEES